MVYSIVLDVKFFYTEGLFKVLGPYQRGKAYIKAYCRLAVYGQKFPVPPHIWRPLCYYLSCNILLYLVIIVINLKGAEAELAYMQSLFRISLPAFPAF